MATKVEALEIATWYYECGREGVSFDKSRAVTELAALGIFSAKEVADILGCSVEYVRKNMGMYAGVTGGAVDIGPVLSALLALAKQWETHKSVSALMLQTLVRNRSASVLTIHRFTDIPLDEIRKAVR